MTNTHRNPHTVADRDAERARLAAYFTAREAASLPIACPACGAQGGEPCRPASLTQPHAARERAYGDRLRRATPSYPTPNGRARRWTTGLTAHLYHGEDGKANPYLLGGLAVFGGAALHLPVLGIMLGALLLLAVAAIVAAIAGGFDKLTR